MGAISAKVSSSDLRALSSDGKWLAASTRSFTAPKNSVTVWNIATARKAYSIPTATGKTVAFIGLFRDDYLLLGVRSSDIIRVFEINSGKELDTISLPARLNEATLSFSAAGAYFTSHVDSRLQVYKTKSGEQVAFMETPRDKSENETSDVQSFKPSGTVFYSVRRVVFSPDGLELAAITRDARLFCWNFQGELVFDEELAGARSRRGFKSSLVWLPENKGWMVGNHIVDRAAKRVVASVPGPPGIGASLHPLGQNKFVGRLERVDNALSVIDIPQEAIDLSVALMSDETSAWVSPFVPVRINVVTPGHARRVARPATGGVRKAAEKGGP